MTEVSHLQTKKTSNPTVPNRKQNKNQIKSNKDSKISKKTPQIAIFSVTDYKQHHK